MEKNEVARVARLSAMQTVKSLHGEFGDIVRSALPIALAETRQDSKPAPMYRRAYVETPVKQPGNYGQATMESARWRGKKGACLGVARMYKSDDGVLLIEQYGTQCSMLHRAERFEHSMFDKGTLVKAGSAPWDKFYPAEGDLHTVIAKMHGKGWRLITDHIPNKQLELLPLPDVQDKEVRHV